MTEYMMNSSGSWSRSGRHPANGLIPRSLNSSCCASRDFTWSPLKRFWISLSSGWMSCIRRWETSCLR